MTLNFAAKVKGIPQLQQPINSRFRALSVERQGQAAKPQLAGQRVRRRTVLLRRHRLDGRQRYVSFQGTNYEVGPQGCSVQPQLAQNSGQGKTLKDYGIDPRPGSRARPIRARQRERRRHDTRLRDLDVGRMFSDFNKTIQKAGGASRPPRRGSSRRPAIQTDQASGEEPEVRHLRREDDSKIRRLSVSVDFQIPSDQRQSSGAPPAER